jgi:hypothetical protein
MFYSCPQNFTRRAEMETTQEAPTDIAQQHNAYPVDAPVQKVNVTADNGKIKAVVTHSFAPLKLEHLTRYAAEVINETELQAGGRQVSRIDLDAAETYLFDVLTQGASVAVSRDGKQFVREVPGDAALEFTLEEKMKALDRLRACAVRVETTVEDEGIDFLFEKDGEMLVTLLVGDEEKPAYTVPLRMKRPSGVHRQQLRAGFVKQERKQKRGRIKTRITTDFRKAVEFFDRHFIAAEGVSVKGVAFTPETYPDFLASFNPFYKAEIATTMVQSFEQDESD